MSKMHKDSQGSRLRYLRKEILRLTQDKLAQELGVTRSLIPTMESDKQGVSRQTAEKLFALYQVSSAWLLHGVGDPIITREGPANPYGSTESGEPEMSYSMTYDAVYLFDDPTSYRYGKGKTRFGYLPLSGTKLRLHAARDKALLGTALWTIVEDDDTWFVAGEPDGWEFEVLREYLAYRGDRTLPEWMECLRIIRWQRQLLVRSAQEREESERAAKRA